MTSIAVHRESVTKRLSTRIPGLRRDSNVSPVTRPLDYPRIVAGYPLTASKRNPGVRPCERTFDSGRTPLLERYVLIVLGSHFADFAGRLFGEPQVAVGAERDPVRLAGGGRDRELGHGAGGRDLADRPAIHIVVGEIEVRIRAGGDEVG